MGRYSEKHLSVPGNVVKVRQPGSAVPAIVVGLSVVLSALVVSTMVAFRSTPPPLSVSCLEPKNASSREVTLFPQGDDISVRSGGFANSSLPIHFCLDQSVDLVGAWNSSQPVLPFVMYTWILPYYLGCDPQYCFHRNGTFAGPLFPGSYAMGFFTDTWANVSVNVTQPMELVFDRVTEMLQPAGPVYLPPGGYSDWLMSIPSGAKDVGFDASQVDLNFGFYAGLMNASQFAAFQQSPSPSDFQGLSWGGWSNQGMGGSVLTSSCLDLHLAPGNYTLVVWNSSSGNGVLQFDDPLYLAFNAS